MTAWAKGLSLARFRFRKSTLRFALILLAMAVDPAHALCLAPPEPELSKLADLAGQNPQEALVKLKTKITHSKADNLPVRTVAWLHAIEGDAYWQLSNSEGGERAARAGLALPIDKSDPVYVQLLIQYVFRDFRTETFRASLPLLTAARAKFRPGSEEDICLQATLGDVQRLSGDFASAATNLVSAYRTSQSPERERQHIYAAYALALFMRSAGDYERALQLLSERVAWNRKRGYDFMQGGDYFVTGRFLLRAGRYREALEKIDLAIEAGTRFRDERGIAYYRLQRCAALTGVGRLTEAGRVCEQVASFFRNLDQDMVAEAQVLMADVAIREQKPLESLALLDKALSPDTSRSWSFPESDAYLLRSKAHAALGQTPAAYRDLTEYVRLNAVEISNERTRQVISREAEREADRQITRNLVLHQKLKETRARSHNQMMTTIWFVSAAFFIILLLTATALMARRAKSQLEKSANIDSLTGLWNRGKLTQLGKVAMSDSVRTKQPLSVAIIDIDHFKLVNDAFGHAVGDEVLKGLSAVMQDDIRDSDILGRWGGEEFLLLMPNTSPTSAMEVLERIREKALAITLPTNDEVRVSFSAGISAMNDNDLMMDAIINRADVALYAAKRSGRGKTLCWSKEMTHFKAQTISRT